MFEKNQNLETKFSDQVWWAEFYMCVQWKGFVRRAFAPLSFSFQCLHGNRYVCRQVPRLNSCLAWFCGHTNKSKSKRFAHEKRMHVLTNCGQKILGFLKLIRKWTPSLTITVKPYFYQKNAIKRDQLFTCWGWLVVGCL
jgi:hypothetical protein